MRKISLILFPLLVLCLTGTVVAFSKLQDQPHAIHSYAASNTAQLNIYAGFTKGIFTHNDISLSFDSFDLYGYNDALVSVPQLVNVVNSIKPAFIRIGDNQNVGWTRNCTNPCKQYMYHPWKTQGSNFTYEFADFPQEIDQEYLFAKETNTNIILNVNIDDDNPGMWTDLVHYANVENHYNIHYWELGNEPDFYSKGALSASTYQARVTTYEEAMLKVDPTIVFVGGVTSTPQELVWQNGSHVNTTNISPYFTAAVEGSTKANAKLAFLSTHWYQLPGSNASNFHTLAWWEYGGTPNNSIPVNDPRNQQSRHYVDIFPERMLTQVPYKSTSTGIFLDEMNVDGGNPANILNGNYQGSLHEADIIGRGAYNGISGLALYNTYGGANNDFSMIYPDNLTNPRKLNLKPTFYPYFMYSHYFGNGEMYLTNNDHPEDISIYASNDTSRYTHTKTMSIMVINTSQTSYSTTIKISGFPQITGAEYFQMTSTNPTDTSIAGAMDNGSTKINGDVLNAMNIRGSSSSIKPQGIYHGITATSLPFTFPAYSMTSILVWNH